MFIQVESILFRDPQQETRTRLCACGCVCYYPRYYCARCGRDVP